MESSVFFQKNQIYSIRSCENIEQTISATNKQSHYLNGCQVIKEFLNLDNYIFTKPQQQWKFIIQENQTYGIKNQHFELFLRGDTDGKIDICKWCNDWEKWIIKQYDVNKYSIYNTYFKKYLDVTNEIRLKKELQYVNIISTNGKED